MKTTIVIEKRKSNENVCYQDFKACLFFFYFVQSFIPIFGPQLSSQNLKKTSNNRLSSKITMKITWNYVPCSQKHVFRHKNQDDTLGKTRENLSLKFFILASAI